MIRCLSVELPWSFFVLFCLFVELLPECSFVELWSVRSSSCGEFVRRAAVGLSSSCGEFVRRAAVGLSSSCCRECSFVELLSECSLVELLSECSLVELLFGTRNSRKNEPSGRCRSKQSSEEAMEAMPKKIEITLSGSEMAPPFHRTRRILLNYCAAYFFRKDCICVALAYFFPGRVRRFFYRVRFKCARSTLMIRYSTETFFGPLLYVSIQEYLIHNLIDDLIN